MPRERDLRLDPGQAELVVGPRQAGKSTLAWWALQTRGGPALLLDCEEPAEREDCGARVRFLGVADLAAAVTAWLG